MTAQGMGVRLNGRGKAGKRDEFYAAVSIVRRLCSRCTSQPMSVDLMHTIKTHASSIQNCFTRIRSHYW